jgi:hypothetical protein
VSGLTDGISPAGITDKDRLMPRQAMDVYFKLTDAASARHAVTMIAFITAAADPTFPATPVIEAIYTNAEQAGGDMIDERDIALDMLWDIQHGGAVFQRRMSDISETMRILADEARERHRRRRHDD